MRIYLRISKVKSCYKWTSAENLLPISDSSNRSPLIIHYCFRASDFCRPRTEWRAKNKSFHFRIIDERLLDSVLRIWHTNKIASFDVAAVLMFMSLHFRIAQLGEIRPDQTRTVRRMHEGRIVLSNLSPTCFFRTMTRRRNTLWVGYMQRECKRKWVRTHQSPLIANYSSRWPVGRHSGISEW